MMFGLTIVASLVVITMIWSRLVHHKVGAAAAVPTLWIVLGPLGQSITAAHTLGATATGTVALAHNGNLTNTAELKTMIMARNGGQLTGEMKQGNTSDTALVTALLEGEEGKSLEQTALELLPKIKGGFCFVFMDEGTLYAARDTYGIRPLVLGRLERGWVVASEQSALATVGAGSNVEDTLRRALAHLSGF